MSRADKSTFSLPGTSLPQNWFLPQKAYYSVLLITALYSILQTYSTEEPHLGKKSTLTVQVACVRAIIPVSHQYFAEKSG